MILTGENKALGEKLSHCHFVHMYYVSWPRIEPRPLQGEAGD
jgi:hypothetical protein